MPGIVLSYRRADSRWIVGRIFDRLEAHFGRERVFMDIDGVPLGIDFREHLRTTLDACDVLLAIIGPNWAKGLDGVNRLDSETDWVRLEIETALQRNVPVIPVLIDDAQVPETSSLPESLRPLTFRQGARLDTGVDFRTHMDRLIRALEAYVQPVAAASATPPAPRPETASAPHAATPPPAASDAAARKSGRDRLFGNGWIRTVIGVLIIVALVRFLNEDKPPELPTRGDPRSEAGEASDDTTAHTSDAVNDLVQSTIRSSLERAKTLQDTTQQAGAKAGAGAGANMPAPKGSLWRVAAQAASGCWKRVTGEAGSVYQGFERIRTYERGVEMGTGPDIESATASLVRLLASPEGVVGINETSFRYSTWTFTIGEPNTLVIDQLRDQQVKSHAYPLVYERIPCSE